MQTFFNLPEAKRRLILDLAIAEFAEHGPMTASVSRIVAQAGIAKGSLYQYFADKQDLFLYLVDLANAERTAFYAQQAPPDPNMGFYDAVRWALELGARFRFSTPAFERLLHFAMFTSHPDQAEVLRRTREHLALLWRPLVERGLATSEISRAFEPEFVIFLCASLSVSLVGYAMQGATENTASEFAQRSAAAYEQFRQILEHGLRGPKE